MSSSSWLGYVLAASMIVTAIYCVSRLAVAGLRGRPTEPAVDIVHVLMGVAMAGMLVPRLSTLPDGAWEATFGAAVAWFGWHAVRAYRAGGTGGRPAHQLPHLLASGAMLYMFLAVTPARTGPPVTAIAMAGGRPEPLVFRSWPSRWRSPCSAMSCGSPTGLLRCRACQR